MTKRHARRKTKECRETRREKELYDEIVDMEAQRSRLFEKIKRLKAERSRWTYALVVLMLEILEFIRDERPSAIIHERLQTAVETAQRTADGREDDPA